MIIERLDQYTGPSVFVGLSDVLDRQLFLKCEGFNFASSIKFRTALFMVNDAEKAGRLGPGTTIVESSSGNLGVALAVISASRDLRFLCVTDPKCSTYAVSMMRATGALVEIVAERDENGNYLAARKRRVRELCAEDPCYVWLNQYENPANQMAHYEITAREIDDDFPQLDVLFVGAGTGGTLMGCAAYLRDRKRSTAVVPVDSVGSVNFGGPLSPRHIAGLGSSEPMSLIDETRVHPVEWVAEEDAIVMCRRMATTGLVVGGSTGTVVEGARVWLERNDPHRELRAVAISPDFGGAYLATVYDDLWCASRYPNLTAIGDADGLARRPVH